MKIHTFKRAMNETKKFAEQYNADRKNVSVELIDLFNFMLNTTVEKSRKINKYFKTKTGVDLPNAMSEYF